MNTREFGRLIMAAVLGSALTLATPALGAVLNQSIGDAFSLGNVNKIDERTDLKGDAKGANLQIKNTGNAGALSAKAGKNAIKAKATSGPVAVNATADRNAIKIRVDAGQSPIKVNASAGTAENLSADMLDGRDAEDLIRVAFDAAANLPDGGSFIGEASEALTTEITAPTTGWLVISGTVDAFSPTNAADEYACHLLVDGVEVVGSVMFSRMYATVTEFNNSENCISQGVEIVDAGQHTVVMELVNVAATTGFGDGSLSVLFVPFDGTGQTAPPGQS